MKKTNPPQLPPDALLDGRALRTVGDFEVAMESWLKPYLAEFGQDSDVKAAAQEFEREIQRLRGLAIDAERLGDVRILPPPPLKDLIDFQSSRETKQLIVKNEVFTQWLGNPDTRSEGMGRLIDDYGDGLKPPWFNILYEFSKQVAPLDLSVLDEVDWEELEKGL